MAATHACSCYYSHDCHSHCVPGEDQKGNTTTEACRGGEEEALDENLKGNTAATGGDANPKGHIVATGGEDQTFDDNLKGNTAG